MIPTLSIPVNATAWARPRTLLALAALTSTPACRRTAAPAAGVETPIESTGSWGGLRVNTVGERRHPHQVVILLHGCGASGDDLVSLGEALAAPGRLFIFPEGPLVSQGGGRAWWHLDLVALQAARQSGREGSFRQDIPAGLPEARAQISALVAEVVRRAHVAPEAVVLGGFSQGAMLATDVVLASPGSVGGLAILSGSLLAEAVWSARVAAMPPGFPVFMSHGRGDPVLPFTFAEALRARLQSAKQAVTWIHFAGGHEIPRVVLAGLEAFLAQRAPDGSPAN